MLHDLDTRLGGEPCEAAHPTRRLQGTVAGMEQRGRKATRERPVEVVSPSDRQSVAGHRVVFRPELVTLLLVGGDAQAADAAEGVTGQPLHPVDRLFRESPEPLRRDRTDHLARHVIRRTATTQREAAVAAARPLCDPAGVDQPNAEPGLGERERARAPGDATADHDGIDGVVMWLRARNRRLVEPVRDHRAIVELGR